MRETESRYGIVFFFSSGPHLHTYKVETRGDEIYFEEIRRRLRAVRIDDDVNLRSIDIIRYAAASGDGTFAAKTSVQPSAKSLWGDRTINALHRVHLYNAHGVYCDVSTRTSVVRIFYFRPDPHSLRPFRLSR